MNYLLKKKKIAQPVGRALSFANAHERGQDILRSYMALEPYAVNDYCFRNDVAQMVGAKNVGEIGKKIGNLDFRNPTQVVASLQAQLGRLEQRSLLDGLGMCELIGRKIDQQELIQIVNFDYSVYGFSKDINEKVMAVSAFAVNPATDLTTCRAAMATIVPRTDVGEANVEDGDDDVKEGKVDEIPPTPVGARVNIVKNIDNKFGECSLEYDIVKILK